MSGTTTASGSGEAEQKHTALPWEAEQAGGKGSWIKGSTGEWAAMSCGDTHESAEANAAFIVRACNSHEALVKALEKIATGKVDDPDETQSAHGARQFAAQLQLIAGSALAALALSRNGGE